MNCSRYNLKDFSSSLHHYVDLSRDKVLWGTTLDCQNWSIGLNMAAKTWQHNRRLSGPLVCPTNFFFRDRPSSLHVKVSSPRLIFHHPFYSQFVTL